MRVLWMSNSPWTPTGYGAQTRYMLPLLQELGYDVASFDFYGLSGGNIVHEGIQHYAGHIDPYGNDAVRGHMVDFKADALITLFDPFVCYPEIYEEIGDRWYPWTPIDSAGLADGMDVLFQARKVITMSTHGEQQLVEAGHHPSRLFYLPHGVNCQLHKNRPEAQRKAIRRELGIPEDAFLVGIVQANKGKRKALAAQIQAFADFRRLNDAYDAHLYVHTEPSTVFDGFDLDRLVEQAGLKGMGVVHRTHTYSYRSGLPEEQMSRLMGSFDVLLQATLGEGFGIPIIEAQANGVPVIVNTGSAMDELVPTTDLILKNPTPVPAHTGGTHFYPNHDEMVRRLEWLYRMKWEDVERLRADCRRHVEHNFDWARLKLRWMAFLHTVEMDQATIIQRPIADLDGFVEKVGGVVVSAHDVDSPDLIEWIEQAPVELVVCPPDRIGDYDFYIVWDENHHDPIDLHRVVQQPYVVIRRGVQPATGKLLAGARCVWFTEFLGEALAHRAHQGTEFETRTGSLDDFWKEPLDQWLT